MAWEALQNLIDRSSRIVFFGGAGVSTESGVPDFRSTDGLYHQQFRYPPETILSHSFFMAHTEEFYDFYREKLLIENALPNPAHRKLAELERAGKMTGVVTQNIDGLHQAAGSKRVIELHGSIHRCRCARCGKPCPEEAVNTVEKAVDEIEAALQNSLDREVSSLQIGELAMDKLKGIDEVAYVRFASVYRQFRDINTFMEELNNLLTSKDK